MGWYQWQMLRKKMVNVKLVAIPTSLVRLKGGSMTVSQELITRMLTYETAWHVEADMP